MTNIQKVLIVFGLVTLDACAEILVRKHQQSAQGAVDGNVGISEAPSLVRDARRPKSMEVGADGRIIVPDHFVDSTDEQSLIDEKPQQSMEVEADGNVDITGHSVDPAQKLLSSLVRGAKQPNSNAAVEPGNFVESESRVPDAGSRKYGPYQLRRNALDYFKQWSKGNIAQQLKPMHSSGKEAQVLLQKETHEEFRSSAGLLGLLHTTSKRTCVKSSRTFDGDATLYNSTGDPDGVFHALLVLPDGALQYAAVFRGTLMAAEPSLCQISKKDDHLDEGEGDAESSAAQNQTGGPQAGATHMLDVENDRTVNDCSDLFGRTVEEQCDTRFEFDVISATEHVIDGIEVEMTLKVTDGAKEYFHSVRCDFEVPWEKGQTVNADGLVATLLIEGSVCEANQRSTTSSSESDSLKLMQSYRFGEISHYKGNEWMRTWYPLVRIPLEPSTPASFDLRQSFPVCFPGNYRGPVRNQGNCGSCWAFAAATAAMTTLCAKTNGGPQVLAGGTRFEISTQQIMSCNSAKRGCNGGWHHSADSAWQQGGLYKDRDFPYKCGHGSARDHFDDGMSCRAWPWGVSCPSAGASPHWVYGGMRSSRGEASMKQLIVRGYGLYVTFAVYNNFFSYRSGVYKAIQGGLAGYHAVVALAYGVANGDKFWTLQNSWGANWGNGGYVNFLRGTDLAGIENLAVYVEISSSAPTPPPTNAPPTPPTAEPTTSEPTPSPAWTVSGPCSIQGSCVTSPNYPASYNNRQRCTISKSFGQIQVVDFNTESYFDKLSIGRTFYTGRRRHTVPNGVIPTADITWASDYSVTRKGWKICSAAPASPAPTPPAPPPTGSPTEQPTAEPTNEPTSEPTNAPTNEPTNEPTPAPTPPPTATRAWTVSGPCSIQGSCVTSPNYPASYNNRQRCTISKSFGQIQVVDFNTEGYFDRLRIGGTYYTGRRRHTVPNGVIPTADITWSSDYSVTRKGWKICSAGPAAPTPAPAPPASYSCGRLASNRDCTERRGRVRLSASSTSSCQTKCAQQSRAGCCEWEHDWRICYFQPSDRSTHADYGSRWCRPCRSASMCGRSRSLLDESEDTMSSSDADKVKLFQERFELLDSNTDGAVDEMEAVVGKISEQRFAELDVNGDSFLNSTEYLEEAWY